MSTKKKSRKYRKGKIWEKTVESTTTHVNILEAFIEQTYPDKNMDEQALPKEELANVLQKLYIGTKEAKRGLLQANCLRPNDTVWLVISEKQRNGT